MTAITDAISELFESFVVTLVSVDGGGRIVDPREARIAIRSSDDPQGVVAFDSYPQGIIINEGDQLMLRYLMDIQIDKLSLSFLLLRPYTPSSSPQLLSPHRPSYRKGGSRQVF